MLKGMRLLSSNSHGLLTPISRMARSSMGLTGHNHVGGMSGGLEYNLSSTGSSAAGVCARAGSISSFAYETSIIRCFGAPSLSHRKFFFMKPTKAKGLLSFRGQRQPRSSWKKANYRTKSMYKLKTCNSLKVRVKIVGPRHDRKFKVLKAGYHHLMRNKTKSARRRANKVKYLHKADLYRVKKMLPYWKRQSFKNTI